MKNNEKKSALVQLAKELLDLYSSWKRHREENPHGPGTPGPKGTTSKTERGFQVIFFDDRSGTHCSLQQSSLAEYEPPGTSAIWLGVDRVDHKHMFSRMHLDREQVKWLIGHLQKWVETGEFNGSE